MEQDSGSNSPTSADVAEQMGFESEEPPADEPLSLVKTKIKVEPGLQNDMPMDFSEALKDDDDPVSKAQMTVAQTSSLLADVSQIQRYTVPHLMDLIPAAVNGKMVRPFKAYNANRELLSKFPNSSSGLNYPAVPVALSRPAGATVPLSVPTIHTTGSLPAVQTSSRNSNGGPTAHLMTLATEADKLLQKTKYPKCINGYVRGESGSGDEAMTPGSTSGSSDSGSAGDLLEETIEKIKKRAALASGSSDNREQILPLPSNSSKRASKKAARNPCPSDDNNDNKDQHYWERRRKNNEAAKRSRDARRAKEDQIAIRAALLEQENMRLRIEVAALKEETVKLRAMLYNKK